MKIGIITFHFPVNYGAVLQTFALSNALESLGHEVEVIDYRPKYHTKKYGYSWRYCGLHLSNFILPGLKKRFDLFRINNLKLSDKIYSTIEDLKGNPPECDAYVCGSDQIWNPDITNFDPAYFLKFGNKSVRRISYAASFGKGELSDEEKKKIKPYVDELDFISIRENSGVDILKTIKNNSVQCVLDPTLLIDDYSSIERPVLFNEEYVLVINLQNNSLLRDVSNHVYRESGLKCIVLNNFSMKRWQQKGCKRYPSPGKYISLVKNANFIVTNSFHGTIFSILFKKNFISTALLGVAAQKNVRITDLLKACKLETRFIDRFNPDMVSKNVTQRIDWEEPIKTIEGQREKSIDFIINALL